MSVKFILGGIKLRSIKTKLVVYFSILILLTSIVIGVTSMITSSAALTEEAEKALIQLSMEGARVTESRIETQMKTLETIADMSDIQSMDWGLQRPILERQVKNSNFLDIGVVHLDGSVYYSDGSSSQLGDRDYVQKALSGEANVSDLIKSRVTNDIVLMYACPIERDGKVVGALIGRRDGNALSIITDDTGYGEDGYAYMINSEGTVVAHRDRDKVLNQFNPIEGAKSDESQNQLQNCLKRY